MAKTRECALCHTKNGSLKACSRCASVFYCSKACQRDHWKQHKKECKPKGSASNSSTNNKATTPVERHLVNEEDMKQVEVTREDQDRINRYGRLNGRLSELKDEIREKRQLTANLSDASDELELLDDDSCIFRIGEVFIAVSNEDAEERVATMAKEEDALLKKKVSERGEIETEMKALREQLYSKFGKTINLETDESD